MSHRNKNLVFTDNDIMDNSGLNNQQKRKINDVVPIENICNSKKNRIENNNSNNNSNIPRRSARLVDKKCNYLEESENDSKDDDTSDSKDDDTSDSKDDDTSDSKDDDTNDNEYIEIVDDSKDDDTSDSKDDDTSDSKDDDTNDNEYIEIVDDSKDDDTSDYKDDDTSDSKDDDTSDSKDDDTNDNEYIEIVDDSIEIVDDSIDIGDEYIEIGEEENISVKDKNNLSDEETISIGSDEITIDNSKPEKNDDENIFEEYDDIVDEFYDEPWFQKLSDEEQVHYINKIRELKTYKENIPSFKDIMDLNINPLNIKILLTERKELNTYDKISPEYDSACHLFMRNFNYLSSPENNQDQEKIKNLEKGIMNQTKFIQPINERILNSDFDDVTKAIIYDKYMAMCNYDAENASKYRNWIEIVLSVPHHPKKIDLEENIPQNIAISNLVGNLMNKLNEKIYGMDEAKEELLCIIANMVANPESKNKAIGLYGPPGIGKTMIGRILADVLGLPMEQISLGGVTDSSFLEGHNFTYIGSEPGCIVKAMNRMKCTNGIIFLDEIDKISKTHNGKEIEHSLLHITDFTQNHDFRDKYIPEIPVDLSKFIFIYSMNTINEMDTALVSRIPIIKFDGYSPKQKIDIVLKYIFPEILTNYGMTINDVSISQQTIEHLIENVQEEDSTDNKSGVRGLKKALNRIINRINLYRLISVNGKVTIKLSFDIPNFKMPFEINRDLIDKIIISDNKNDSDYKLLYI